MSFGKRVTKVTMNVQFNVGCMIDHATGSYYIGKYGQSVLNGGLGDITSIIGIGNSYKSTLDESLKLIICDRYSVAENITYCTENVRSYQRTKDLSVRLKNLKDIDFTDPADSRRDRFTITNSSTTTEDDKVLYGDRFHEMITQYAREVYAQKKPVLYTTAFREGQNPIMLKVPTFVSYDSFTKMKISAIEEGKKEDHKVGDSELNTVALDENRYKTQINNSMPSLARMGEIRFIMTAHTQKVLNMEGKYAVQKQKLTYGKNQYEIKGVGTAFIQINELILDIQACTKLDAKGGGVEYPLEESDKDENCHDLNLLTVVIGRNKHGSAGFVIPQIVSQREGLLQHLSMFRFLKEENYGLIKKGNTNYYLALIPDLALQRTTVRGIINDNYHLRRGLEIVSSMLQIFYLFAPEGKRHLCAPQALYDDLIEMGYNWTTLLNTRDFHVFEEMENDNLPFLSTMDLLRMRAGLYTPYWLNPEYIKQAKGYLKEVLSSIPESELRTK